MLFSTTSDLRAHVRVEAGGVEDAVSTAEGKLTTSPGVPEYVSSSGRGAGVVVVRTTAGVVRTVYSIVCVRLEEGEPERVVVENRRLVENLRQHAGAGGSAEAGVLFVFVPASGTEVVLVVLAPGVIRRLAAAPGGPLRRTSRVELAVRDGRPWREEVAEAGGTVIAYERRVW
ncbi:hypothetical protein [Rothia kristinae]|uniref:hypothetical protein n=1 Tax=Rothia kristinae TaxID=37923 RepID=UPI0022E38A20|nr:hypothetical protein [Rothia kristinae]